MKILFGLITLFSPYRRTCWYFHFEGHEGKPCERKVDRPGSFKFDMTFMLGVSGSRK